MAFVKEIQNVIDGDGNLDDVLNVDSFLKYLAVSTATIHMDSYQSGMNHNYYLYNNNGVIEWISWDLNMIFNGFPQTNFTQEEAINFLIDEPVSGSMNGYLEDETFKTRVFDIYDLMKSYASSDPTAFATIETVEETLFESNDTTLSLIDFMSARVESMSQQLSGEIASTNNGEGNSGSGTAGGMMGGGRPGQVDGEMPEGMPVPMDGERPVRGEKPKGMMQGAEADSVDVVVEANLADSIGAIIDVSALMALVIAFIKRR